MFNALFSLFKKDIALDRVKDILHNLSEIIEIFDEQSLKDKNSKNAAIDSVIQILEQYKDKL